MSEREPATTRAQWTILTILCLAQFLPIVGVVVVNVAINDIRNDLEIPESRLQLISVAYPGSTVR